MQLAAYGLTSLDMDPYQCRSKTAFKVYEYFYDSCGMDGKVCMVSSETELWNYYPRLIDLLYGSVIYNLLYKDSRFSFVFKMIG